MKFYAKTNPKETIREHTDNVNREFYNLKSEYSKEINEIVSKYIDKDDFWEILKMCCEYHDYGKANLQFQNKLRVILGKEKIKCENTIEIPHNYLSPAFLPTDFLDDINAKYGKEIEEVIFQAIGYHHEKDEEPDFQSISKCLDIDLQINLPKINEHMGSNVESLIDDYVNSIKKQKRIKEANKYYNLYIILKGLLHKIDHSASAHQIIEEKYEISIGDATENYREKENWIWRKPQIFAKSNTDKNLVIIASTGMGKTETALLWINNSKSFFTLPLRVSINALFKRVKDEIKYNHVGLIHSTALEYLEDNGYDDAYKIYEEAQLLSKKLSFSTIDQIFKYPFKYRGYEKMLATLAYSKVVIDEIQAYSPQIAAVILYGVKQLNSIGGRFLIMTATLPRIYKDKLNEIGIEFEERMFISDMERHKILIIDDEIINAFNNIREKGKKSKVLVIVNTVDKALEIYKRFDDKKSVKLLHSMFTNEDRARLESEIKSFTNDDNNGNGIWITTQIVEASLDVDFDYLFTEMSTLDSQFQRYGRCYRKRNYKNNEPNVLIYTKNISGKVSIYDEKILEKSITAIKPYSNKILKEDIKVELVDKLYSKESLDGTKFYRDFIEACNYLDNIIAYETTSREAQKILRDIDTIKVIPSDIYNSNIDIIDEYKVSKGEKRSKLLMEINKITLNLPSYKFNKCKRENSYINKFKIDGFNDLYEINAKYSNKIGLLLKELTDNMF